MEKEIWKEITLVQRFTYRGGKIDRYLDFTGKGYKISSLGRLKNAYGEILTNNKIRNGFIVNNLYDVDGKMYTVSRHALIMSTFRPHEYIEGAEIIFLDSNKKNLKLSNLHWYKKKSDQDWSLF